MRPRKITDDQILGSARDCVLEFGPSVSTQKIAEHAGVSQATLFKRFGTKIELLRKALMFPVRGLRIIHRLEQGPGPGPIPGQLRTICMDMIAFFDEMVPCWAAMRSAGIHPGTGMDCSSLPGRRNAAVRARLALESWFCQLADDGRIRKGIDCQATAVALIGSLQTLPFRRHILRDTDLEQSNEEYVEALLWLLWPGLTPGEKT
jgi:AcrR family transcriptional regulator